MILEGIGKGLGLLFRLDPSITGPIQVSLLVSTSATVLATLLGLPLGLLVGLGRFRGKRLVLGVLNTLLALPTVLVGLVVYAMISRQGPLGELELLYTRGAMVAGQALLAFPIVAALTAAAVQRADPRIRQAALGLGAGRLHAALLLAARRRAALLAAMVTAFGRVFSEVGISMMVGGNIRGLTRNITTGIAFETGKGEFAMGVALGVVLLGVALLVNLLVSVFQLGRRES
jgi:tungstate transport system permease protein